MRNYLQNAAGNGVTSVAVQLDGVATAAA